MSETVNIDAEYMNRWLGDNTQVESLAPKTLYDVQTLIEYYRDIIVPTEKVSIAFPTKDGNSPRASVENGEVIIPFYMLKEWWIIRINWVPFNEMIFFFVLR